MFTKALPILSIPILCMCFDVAGAGEFVTQEKPSPGRAVPFCSSDLGCLLSGEAIPKTQLIPDRSELPIPSSAPATAPVGGDGPPVAAVTIAAATPEIDHLKDLVASAPGNRVRVVDVAGRTPPKNIDFYVVTDLGASDAERSAFLFEDQMHILAAADVRALTDLSDQVVSFGPENSESQTVGRRAFEALHIPVRETPLDLDNALDGLSTGDIKAVVVLAPQPIARLRRLATPGLHLMPWPSDVALPAGAEVSSIAPSAYPGLANGDEAVSALGVESVLRKNTARHRVDLDEASVAARLRPPVAAR